MKRFLALLAALLLILCAAGCSGGSGGGKERAELTACEYTETGHADGSYLSVSVTRKERNAELDFQASSGAGTEPLTAKTDVRPEVLDRAAETAARWGMKDWPGDTPASRPEDGVTALRLTYADGSRLYVSTADSLPEGGPAALEEMREVLFGAVTPDGAAVFGGEGSPVDLSILAEPEPSADDWSDTLGPEGLEAVNALREKTMDDGGVYAIAVLGSPDTSGGGVASDRGYLTLMLQAEGYDDLTFLSDLPADRFAELPEGRTLYLILPLDPAAVIEVYRGTSAHSGELMFRGDGALPLVLRCGADPTAADVLVMISASDGSVTEITPCLTDGGQLTPQMRGYDCSAYNRAVG